MGVVEVGVLAGDGDGTGDVGAGLVSVEGDGLPPVGDGGRGGDAAVGGGDGEEEVLDEKLLRLGPLAVPNEVDVDRGRQHRPHVVFELHELRGPLESLGGREGSEGWDLRVEVSWVCV